MGTSSQNDAVLTYRITFQLGVLVLSKPKLYQYQHMDFINILFLFLESNYKVKSAW